jgi:hypothetical protein
MVNIQTGRTGANREKIVMYEVTENREQMKWVATTLDWGSGSPERGRR